MSNRIFISRKIPAAGINILKEKGFEVDIYPHEKVPTQKQLIFYLKKYPYNGVIFLLTDLIDTKVFDAVPTAKIFAAYTVGYNNVDIDAANQRGITVTNTAGASRTCVAEHAVALMLALTTRTVEGDEFIRKGKYRGWTPMAFLGTDLTGKTIGLVGVGSIGSEVARITHRGFDAHILYHDLAQNEQIEKDYGAERCGSLDELLQKSDIVSLHVPLLPSTRHLINESKLKLMKPESFLINTSRGPVVDEKALVLALEKGVIKGAGLDVFEFEPKLTPRLGKLKNAVLTPHIASARESARNKMAEVAANNIVDFFEGRVPRNKINGSQ